MYMRKCNDVSLCTQLTTADVFFPCMRVSQTAAILDPSTGVSIAADNVSMVPLN